MTKTNSNKFSPFFEGQGIHLIALSVLLICLVPIWRHPLLDTGELWGFTSRQLFMVTVANAIAHQVWVWLWWRAELHYGLANRLFGKYAFEIYAAPFFVMLSVRPVLAFMLAYSNQGTLNLPPALSTLLAAVLLLPVLYLGYSIKRYFGFTRAAGADHFYESYRQGPLVRKGIFKYTSNSMYTFGFLIMWVPAIYYASFAALVAALFGHVYIWVHYYCTERPDMRRIYS